MMGRMGMFGPGERQSGTRDVASEAKLPLIQGLLHFALGVVTFAMALLCAFGFGGLLTTLALTVFVWAMRKRAVDWADEHVESSTLFSVIVHTERFWPVLVFVVGALVTRYILPYKWDFDFNTRWSYIVILRTVDGEQYIAGYRFALLLRAFLVALPIAWFNTAPVIRHRFADEVRMAVPAQAERYSEVGMNTRRWGPKPEPPPAAPVDTVTLEITENTPNGNKIIAYPDIHHRPEVRRAFIALNAGTIPNLSKGYISGLGISQGISGDIMAELFDLGFVDYPRDEDGNPDKHQSSYLTARGKGLAARVAGGAF